ncbi:G-protein coupled receptor GRL101-like [Stylophora pistillata]|nr:G-protein coupled receptor GRL101-like [Stylophora pistillata]
MQSMSFYFNKIRTVSNEQFKDIAPSIRFLYLHYNEMRELPAGFFSNMEKLTTATVDTNLMCCHLKKEDADCDFAYVDSFASCETMFRNRAPRICLWVVGIMSLLGAVFVIVWRLVFKETKKKNKIQSIMLIHLAGSDGLMGVYLIIIGVMDAIWAGQYFLHDYNWRSSLSCQITGAIAVLSSEVSVMTICLLSADRVKNILFPYRGKSLTIKVTHLLCLLIWIVGGIIAFIPTVGIVYFGSRQKGHHFYGRSVVCLPLQLSADKPSGWEYSVAMFVGLNFSLVFFVIVAYSMIIYQSCTSNRRLAQQGTERERKMKAKKRAANLRREASLAKRVFFIVLTDCVCWLPIVVIGMRSLLEKSFRTPGDLAVWIAVFVLPVNSAINPILYTLSTKQVRRVLSPKFQQLLGYLMQKCGRNQNNESQDEGMEMRVIEEVQIHRDAESDDSDDTDDESKDQSAHVQNAEQTDHEEPEERDETEQDEQPEEDHQDPSEQKDEPEKREKESEQQQEQEESENECKESKGQNEDNIEDESDKQEEELKGGLEESEEQDENNMDDEAGEDEQFIMNKDKHQADDNLPAASGRESPRAPLATFDDDCDLDHFYEALDGLKETSV